MQTTFIIKNLTESAIDEVKAMTPRDAHARKGYRAAPESPDQYRSEGADAMRAACVHAVNATASPIVGTPYSAGGRAFADAIRAIDVDDVLARLPPAPDPEARLADAITPAPQPEAATPTAQEAEAVDLTYQQKLEALSLRFYQGMLWTPKAGDYYTTSRADLELYRVVAVEGGMVKTQYCDQSKSSAVSSWPEKEFTSEGFGPKRVWVPDFVLSAHPPQPSETVAAVERAFDKIRELNMSGRDENGHRWANSDLIDQTVREGLVALRALKGGAA